jgi:hypothetical protein
VAKRGDSNASPEIEIFLTLLIPDARALATHKGDIVPAVGRHDVFGKKLLSGHLTHQKS